MTHKPMQTLGVMVQMACIWEASARKPGNVHRFADFADLSYLDFLVSAAAIGGVLDRAWYRPVGEIVLEAIKATRVVTNTNTNLGIVLALTPLASVVPGRSVRPELPRILRGLTIADAVLVYEAIRAANPGGLGDVPEQDVAGIPTVTLREAMAMAADRDRIAWQYVHDFEDVFEVGVPTLARELANGRDLESAIVAVHLAFLQKLRDSLIERKHGSAVADEVREAARTVRGDSGEFDAMLRSRRLNPGTSADLTAASLFVALRESIIPLPFAGTWSPLGFGPRET